MAKLKKKNMAKHNKAQACMTKIWINNIHMLYTAEQWQTTCTDYKGLFPFTWMISSDTEYYLDYRLLK